ncbi:MAG: hypothetical protein HYR85_03845 [Planctomycetes bacterium]|nr:hypothetical protein [Planctomycetota bacterium]MBI3848495.1 hypothetical protein [Planctomycetota bacterium]
MGSSMPLPTDLLEQARLLATCDKKRPKQANLRRAVSSTYYALFHLLVRDSTRRLLRGRAQAPFRPGFARAFSHLDVKRASRAFVAGTLPVLGAVTVPTELKFVAAAIVDLQEERQRVDYDLSTRFARGEVLSLIARAETAFRAWGEVRRRTAAHLFLTMLLAVGRLSNR